MKSYDYAGIGAYFITVCTEMRKCYFGDIVKGEMNLSVMGQIAHQCWNDIPNHFSDVQLDEYRVMPNHVHGIVMINHSLEIRHTVGTRHVVSLLKDEPNRKFGPLPAKSLHTIIGSYKSAVTKFIRAKGFAFGWQSRFHDHIIRDEKELNNIRRYIDNNPAKWEFDRENPDQSQNFKILKQPEPRK